MRLKIKNFGKVRSADICWEGLTVIAGRNDTGKSTIGKLFFSINKAMTGFRDIYNEDFGRLLSFECLSEISRLLRLPNRGELFSDGLIEKMGLLRSRAEKLRMNVNFFVEEKLKEEVVLLLQEMLSALGKGEQKESGNVLSSILRELQTPVSEATRFNFSLSALLRGSFDGKYNNSLHSEIPASLEYFVVDGGKPNLSFGIKNNKVDVVALDVAPTNPFFLDTTLFEMPCLVDSRYRGGVFGNHSPATDFLEKMAAIRTGDKSLEKNELSAPIANVLGGAAFSVDSESREFRYRVDPAAEALPLIDVASGAKAWGGISLLIDAGFIGKDSPLILDEPENHLHPEWQIAFAKFIVGLVAKGVPVLLTSHSPTLIHALIKASLKAGKLSAGTHFYFAKSEGDNFSSIEDVTGATNKIFKDLSSPVEELWSE